MTLRERTKILVAKEKHYTAKIIKTFGHYQ